MKIGVFGDSFADKTCSHTWWNYLESYQREVTCFGEKSSSIGFSVDKIEQYHNSFDRIIWCVTATNRISFWHADEIHHMNICGVPNGYQKLLSAMLKKTDPVLARKQEVIGNYLVEAFDYHHQERAAQALVHHMLSTYRNLMVIPCFDTPVYFRQTPKFNLFELCKRETAAALPDQDPYDVILYGSYDRRQAHLTRHNHQILAKLINQQLDQSIFTTEYEHFLFDQAALRQEIGP